MLKLVESGFDRLHPDSVARRAALDGNREGWNLELDELVALLALLEMQDSP